MLGRSKRVIIGSTQIGPVTYPSCVCTLSGEALCAYLGDRLKLLPGTIVGLYLSMALLERNKCLTELQNWLRLAIEGEGCIALLGGEAGIGKTALLQELAKASLGVRVLWGGCDALFSPRPLGPLYDIARQTQGELWAAINGNAPEARRYIHIVSSTNLQMQRQPGDLLPTVVEARAESLKVSTKSTPRYHSAYVLAALPHCP